MRDFTFWLDGENAKYYGITLQDAVRFSEAEPIYDAETIPGRNGDLIFETGSFENRTGTADCFILQNDAYNAVGPANRFLLAKRGYRRLQVSDDPLHYWMAIVQNGVEIENRRNFLIPFELEFDCKPQRFLVDGENPIEFSESGLIMNHYGFDALPLITVYGTGRGTLTIGSRTVEIKENDGSIILDSETQNAYNNYANKNNAINAPEFPVLRDGENVVKFSGGIERVKIVPRWWEL